MYLAFVALGALAGFVAARLVPMDDETPPAVANRVRVAALAFGVAGAYLAELPADALGLAPDPSHPRWLGRTVLGGLLFGWLGVELTKWHVGHRRPTGDRFAFPLAVSLAIGRVGCVVDGCCRGVPVAADSIAGRVGRLVHGDARFPAALVESYFHVAMAGVVLSLHRNRALAGARLALYLALYSVVRFLLEWVRDVPRPFFGFSYYQGLSAALFVLASATLIARIRTSRSTVEVGETAGPPAPGGREPIA